VSQKSIIWEYGHTGGMVNIHIASERDIMAPNIAPRNIGGVGNPNIGCFV
jgi:hypothetical protein